jgi:hypothetical protein
MTGAGQNLQGQLGILQNQTSFANANQGDSFGSLLGAGAGVVNAGAAAKWWSSKKLKEGKTTVDAYMITRGLQRIPVEAWKYKDGVADSGEHIGPYAEDVQREFGDAAAPGGVSLDPVSMNGISLMVAKQNADRLDRIEKRIGLERKD